MPHAGARLRRPARIGLVRRALDFSSTGRRGRRARPYVGSSSGPLPQLGPAPRGGNPGPVSGPAACVLRVLRLRRPATVRRVDAISSSLPRARRRRRRQRASIPRQAGSTADAGPRTHERPAPRTGPASHRTNTGYGKVCPQEDSNLRPCLRRAVLYPLSYGGQGARERGSRVAPAARPAAPSPRAGLATAFPLPGRLPAPAQARTARMDPGRPPRRPGTAAHPIP